MIGVDHVRIDLDMAYLVRSGTVRAIVHTPCWLKTRIATTVVDQTRLACGDSAIGPDPGFERHYRRMPGVGGHQFLHISHDHTDRLPGGTRQPVGHVRIHEGAFTTEVAANERGIDAHHILGDINTLSKLLAHLERHFAVDPDLHTPGGVQGEHGRMRLDVRLVLVLRAEGMLEVVRRLAKALFDITVFPD